MKGNRGVHQVPVAGDLVQVNLMTSGGRVPVTFLIDPSEVSPAVRRQMIDRAQRWLDRIDPPLRLVAGSRPASPVPAQPPPRRSPAQ